MSKVVKVKLVMMANDKVKSYLPASWNDELRMDAMFSDFRNRDVNPSDWDGKFNFWKGLINDWCRVTSRLTFTFAETRNAFCRNGRIPRGLKTVETLMAKENNIMTLDSYVKMCSDQGWMSWSVDLLIKKPISYSWSLISKAMFSYPVEIQQYEYVNCDIISEKAEMIMERHKSLVEKGDEDDTIAMKSLAKHCQDICKTERDLELCCMWLKKEKRLSIFKDGEHVVVKFFNSNIQSTQLSEMEKAVVQLRMVKKTLEQQIDLCDKDIVKYTEEAKAHLAGKSRQLAKLSLQKKKQSESMLKKKENTLDNIELLLSRLQDASTQKSVLDALQAGSAAFKIDQKMDLDKLDETMAAVQETIEMQEEIQEAVSFNIGPQHDASELEKELEDILSSGDVEDSDEEISHPDDRELMARLNKLRSANQSFELESPTRKPSAKKAAVKA